MSQAPTDIHSICAFRPLAKADEPFIFNSWLKSYRDAPAVRSVPNTIYFQEHHDVIEAILKSPAARVLVACNPEDSSQIYGYGVCSQEGPVVALHWVYVKHPFRSSGIGRALAAELTATALKIFYTHSVKSAERFVREKPYVFNPYLLKGMRK